MQTLELDLFQHNRQAYEAALGLMQQSGRAAVIHPTGTGKSFVAFKLAEEHPGSRILWLSPSEYIYRTQVENLAKALEGASAAAGVVKGITFMTYARLTMNGGRLCSSEIQADDSAFEPDYIILDEFHRCGAAEWEKSVAKLLRDHPRAKVLGLSATSVRYLDGQRDMAQELFDGCIASEMTLGEAVARDILPAPRYVISLYSCEEELQCLRRRVADSRTPGLQRENERLLEELRRALEQADGLEEIFSKHMRDDEGNRILGKYIVFCSGKQHMDEMMAKASEWFALVDRQPHLYAAYYGSPQTSADFARFKEDDSDHLRLLFCIDMLNEGVHVDDIDGVILLRPTISPIVYLQQIGRALSAAKCGSREDPAAGEPKNKEDQAVSVPKNKDRAVSMPKNKEDQAVSVPKGRRDHPPVIYDLVDNINSLEHIDSFRAQIAEAFAVLPHSEQERKRFEGRFRIYDELRSCRELFDRLGRNLSAAWEVYYQAASEYYVAHGNLHIVKSYVTPGGLTLGAWLMTQRRIRSGSSYGTLTEEQIARLDAIGMEWENGSDRKWKRGYEALRAYVETYGNADVKAAYVNEEGYPLGKWIHNLRCKWNRGEVEANAAAEAGDFGAGSSGGAADGHDGYEGHDGHNGVQEQKSVKLLTREQIAQLNALGMVWDKKKYLWEVNFHRAETYYRTHGDLNVPHRYETEDGAKLGIWLDNQRQAYRGKKKRAPLEQSQIRRLETIGMIWQRQKASAAT